MPAISYALNYYLILGLLSDLSGNNLDEIPRVGTPKTLARALLGGPLDWCPDSSIYWRPRHHRIIPSLTENPPETSRLVFGTDTQTTRFSPPHLTFSNNFVNNYRGNIIFNVVGFKFVYSIHRLTDSVIIMSLFGAFSRTTNTVASMSVYREFMYSVKRLALAVPSTVTPYTSLC